jgi:glycosyltransferase involved in cell wall biosynthesis
MMDANRARPHLVFALNSAIAVGFLEGQLEYFQKRGFSVTVLSPGRRGDEWQVAHPDGVLMVEMPMERTIAPLRDIVTLSRMWRTMRILRPTVTNVGTPKAGLLGGFAAWLNRVPCRFYTLHGLRFETTKGLKRLLLLSAERLACKFAHRVVCVSHSVREKAIAYGLTHLERTVVFGSGSCNGIEASRFAPKPELIQRATNLRRHLGIPEHATVIMFVGRFTRDKGIPELVKAFLTLDHRLQDLRLLLVGCLEKEDPLPKDTWEQLQDNPHIIFAGAVQDTPAYYAAADIVALPSHREGLPTVVLEAQAAGKPVVAASATGVVDVVIHGKTGLLFPVGNAEALAGALARLIADRALARRLGLESQEQVKREFQPERIWDAIHQAYLEILQKNAPAKPSVLHRPNSKRLAAVSHQH